MLSQNSLGIRAPETASALPYVFPCQTVAARRSSGRCRNRDYGCTSSPPLGENAIGQRNKPFGTSRAESSEEGDTVSCLGIKTLVLFQGHSGTSVDTPVDFRDNSRGQWGRILC